MTDKVLQYIKNQYGVLPEYLWVRLPDTAVLRNNDNKKWFAALMKGLDKSKLGLLEEGCADVLNVKCPPEMIDSIVDNVGVFRAYHMNKEHWVSLLLDGTLPLEDIKFYIDVSYKLIDNKPKIMKIEIKKYNYLPADSLDLRITVFVKEQGFTDEKDDTDDVATHLVAYHGSLPIANCRIFESNKKGVYILGRLCVLKEYRGQGIGKAILDQAEKEVVKMRGHALTLHSQLHAKDFYTECGYIVSSPVESEQGQPHVWLTKKLK